MFWHRAGGTLTRSYYGLLKDDFCRSVSRRRAVKSPHSVVSPLEGDTGPIVSLKLRSKNLCSLKSLSSSPTRLPRRHQSRNPTPLTSNNPPMKKHRLPPRTKNAPLTLRTPAQSRPNRARTTRVTNANTPTRWRL